MKKKKYLLFLFMTISLVLLGCSKNDETNNEETNSSYLSSLNFTVYKFDEYISDNITSSMEMKTNTAASVRPGIKYYILIEFNINGNNYTEDLGEDYKLNIKYSGASITLDEAGTANYSESDTSLSLKYSYLKENEIHRCSIGLFAVFQYNATIAVNYLNYANYYRFAVDNSFDFSINQENEATITAIYNSLEEITIPSVVGEYRVVGIASNACTSKNLKKVIIEEGIETIDDFAFSGCVNLESIEAKGIKSIGNYAFYNCNSLKEVSLGNNLESIGEWAFSECLELENITLPSKITTISRGLFANCTSLNSITFSGNVAELGKLSTKNCNELKYLYFVNDVPSNFNFNENSSVTLVKNGLY